MSLYTARNSFFSYIIYLTKFPALSLSRRESRLCNLKTASLPPPLLYLGRIFFYIAYTITQQILINSRPRVCVFPPFFYLIFLLEQKDDNNKKNVFMQLSCGINKYEDVYSIQIAFVQPWSLEIGHRPFPFTFHRYFSTAYIQCKLDLAIFQTKKYIYKCKKCLSKTVCTSESFFFSVRCCCWCRLSCPPQLQLRSILKASPSSSSSSLGCGLQGADRRPAAALSTAPVVPVSALPLLTTGSTPTRLSAPHPTPLLTRVSRWLRSASNRLIAELGVRRRNCSRLQLLCRLPSRWLLLLLRGSGGG